MAGEALHVVDRSEGDVGRGQPGAQFRLVEAAEDLRDDAVGVHTVGDACDVRGERASFGSSGRINTSVQSLTHSRSLWIEISSGLPSFVVKTP